MFITYKRGKIMLVYICLVLLFIWNVVLTVLIAYKGKDISKVNGRYSHKVTLDLRHKSLDEKGVQQSYTYKPGFVTRFLLEKCDNYGVKIINSKYEKYDEILKVDMLCTDTEFNLIVLELLETFVDIKIEKM